MSVDISQIREVTIAYVAGFVDGEGYVCFNYGHIDKRRKESGQTFIRVTNSYKPVLVYLQSILGGSIHPNPPKNPKHKMSWIWQLRSRATFMLLSRMVPYLHVKQELANLILKNKALITKQGPRTEGERMKCRHLSKQIRALNKRGL
jgi:hypothetical protein